MTSDLPRLLFLMPPYSLGKLIDWKHHPDQVSSFCFTILPTR
uniref:Uncharacterized protein n=1 Tax=Planktothrix agardhii TaxID=1160 RepID=A0A1J1JPJ5_PLAAG|nr:protein of unknown function [Planktothrix agardhii]